MKNPVYRGNIQSKEFHSIRRHKPQCNFDKIKERVEFRTGRQARAAGYDACFYCCTYWRSKR